MRACSTKILTSSIATILLQAGCGDPAQADSAENIELREQALFTAGPPRGRIAAQGQDLQGPNYAHAQSRCASYYPNTADSDRRKACEKMFVAQYYGDVDISYTFEGTIIEWSDSGSSMGKSARPSHKDIFDSAGKRIGWTTIEAIWGPDGVLCFSWGRHQGLYWFNKPAGRTLPDCRTDPGDLSKPWIGNPFPGRGMQLISYSVNAIETLTFDRDTRTGDLALGGALWYTPYYEMLGQVFNASGFDIPVRIRDASADPVIYESASDEYYTAKIWQSCDSSTPSKCDYITTTQNPNDSSVRSELELRTGHRMEKTFNLFSYGAGMLTIPKRFSKTSKANMVAISTYLVVQSSGRRQYVTATEEMIRKLGYVYNLKLWEEGFVYPNWPTSIIKGP
jgi:hypothetical protein